MVYLHLLCLYTIMSKIVQCLTSLKDCPYYEDKFVACFNLITRNTMKIHCTTCGENKNIFSNIKCYINFYETTLYVK